MTDVPFIVDVDESNFAETIIEGSMQQPVLVDFWASWCQPCQILMPLLAELAREYQGKFVLAKVNTEQAQALAMQFGIRSIPTVKLFKGGEEVDEFQGALPEAEIRAFLDKHIARESDGLVKQAEQALRAGDGETALALIKQANQDDPANTRVLTAYARIQAVLGNMDEARTVIDALPEEIREGDEVKALLAQIKLNEMGDQTPPEEELLARLAADENDSEARYQLAVRKMMNNDPQGAMDELLLLMRKDRGYDDGAAQKMLLQIFETLGSDPLVTRYRGKMMSLIY